MDFRDRNLYYNVYYFILVMVLLVYFFNLFLLRAPKSDALVSYCLSMTAISSHHRMDSISTIFLSVFVSLFSEWNRIAEIHP